LASYPHGYLNVAEGVPSMFDFHYCFVIEFLVREEDGPKKGWAGAVGSQGGAPQETLYDRPRGVRGVVSFPFKPGEHQRIAVKVIDFRGNEVVRVVPCT